LVLEILSVISFIAGKICTRRNNCSVDYKEQILVEIKQTLHHCDTIHQKNTIQEIITSHTGRNKIDDDV